MSNELAKQGVTGTLTVRTMDDLARLGNMLAQSGFFTDSRDAAQAGVKVLAGLEMGIGAFSAMSGIHIIKGKPSVGAGLMAAAVKRHPKYDYRVQRHDNAGCEIVFYEDGENIGVSSFTTDDAKQAGLLNNDNWKRNPKNMLFARALSNGVRWYTPDVFDVSTYTPEELGVDTDADGNVIDVQPAPKREALEPTPEPEPVEVEPSEAETAAADDGEFPPEPPEGLFGEPPVTAAQLKALHTRLTKLGFNGKTEHKELAREFIGHLVGRDLGSSKDLTKSEAHEILDTADSDLEARLDSFTALRKMNEDAA